MRKIPPLLFFIFLLPGMAEQGKHIPVFLGYKDDGSLNVKWDAYTNDNYGFKAKHKLLPFPEEEMNINPNIKQNAGW